MEAEGGAFYRATLTFRSLPTRQLAGSLRSQITCILWQRTPKLSFWEYFHVGIRRLCRIRGCLRSPASDALPTHLTMSYSIAHRMQRAIDTEMNCMLFKRHQGKSEEIDAEDFTFICKHLAGSRKRFRKLMQGSAALPRRMRGSPTWIADHAS